MVIPTSLMFPMSFRASGPFVDITVLSTFGAARLRPFATRQVGYQMAVEGQRRYVFTQIEMPEGDPLHDNEYTSAVFSQLASAFAAANGLYSKPGRIVRQEVQDLERGDVWFRGDGDIDWHRGKPMKRLNRSRELDDFNERAGRVDPLIP